MRTRIGEIPKSVQEARYHYDHRALSAMGKKGARVKAENQRLWKEEEKLRLAERLAEVALERARTETVTAEGDVLPPDPKVVKTLEES